MFRLLWFCIVAVSAWAADDPWAKVRSLKSGTEIRIVRDGVKAPLTGRFDEARENSVVVILRNEQLAIPRSEIQRLDARPSGRRVRNESKTTVSDPDAGRPPAGPPAAGARQSTTHSAGLSLSKPDFETIYRRK